MLSLAEKLKDRRIRQEVEERVRSFSVADAMKPLADLLGEISGVPGYEKCGIEYDPQMPIEAGYFFATGRIRAPAHVNMSFPDSGIHLGEPQPGVTTYDFRVDKAHSTLLIHNGFDGTVVDISGDPKSRKAGVHALDEIAAWYAASIEAANGPAVLQAPGRR